MKSAVAGLGKFIADSAVGSGYSIALLTRAFVCLPASIGRSDEFHRHFTPRSYSLFDLTNASADTRFVAFSRSAKRLREIDRGCRAVSGRRLLLFRKVTRVDCSQNQCQTGNRVEFGYSPR